MPKNWTTQDILDLMRAYQPACVLGVAAELELFGLMAAGPQTAADLAARAGADGRALVMLLDALVALDLLTKDGPRYACAPGVAAALTAGKGSVLAMAQHQMNCLRRWSQLAQVVKTGRPAPRTASIRGEAGDNQSFIEAMNDLAGPVAPVMIPEINVVPWTRVLDVGGGSGTWTLAWLAANPAGRATLFDLPHVIPLARTRLTAAGVAFRVTLVPGDFVTDPLPAGADLAWISAIIHQQSRAQNQELYRKVAGALTPGGHIMIRDMVMDERRTAPVAGALFAINMLTGTQTGGTFTFAEIQEDLQAAGFGAVRLLRPDTGMNAVVIAQC